MTLLAPPRPPAVPHPGGDDGPARPSGRAVATAGVVALACWLATHELDRLVSGVADAHDRSSSLGDVLSASAFAERGAWATWSAGPGGLRSLLLLHALLGVPFLLAAGLLLRWGVRECAKARAVAGLYVVAEAATTGLLVLCVATLDRSGDPDVPVLLAGVLAASAVLSRVLLAGALLLAATSADLRAAAWRAVVRTWHGLYFQRLSLAVVGLVALLALVPGPNVWDQVPDVQRGWVADCPDPLGGDCRGAVHGLVVLLLAPVLAAGLLLLGRQRAELAAAAARPGYRGLPAVTTWWWAVPLGTGLLALALGPVGLDVVGVDPPFWAFVGLPAALLLLSRLVRSDPPDEPWRPPPERVDDVRLAGDVLALALPVVLLLALVRAYTSLAASALVAGPAAALSSASWTAATLLLLLAVPAALAVVARGPDLVRRAAHWRARPSGVRRTVSDLLDPRERDALRTPLARSLPLLAFLLAALGLTAVLLAPLSLTQDLGVLGTALLCLGLWAVLLGFLQVRLQVHRPLPVFRWAGLRATPLLTLLVAVPLLATLLPPDRDLHEVRALAGAPPVQAPLAQVVDDWVAETARCAVPSAVPGTDVQPLLLVAASGGGIRAAYWTAHLLDRLQQHGPCGTDATLLSSGVSGGAVGLAVSRDGSGVAAVERMADPDALSAATGALLVGDLVAGTTGLRVPALLDGEDAWLDRAGLMERRWEELDPGLSDRFDRRGDGPGGALVLNSAAAGVGCRVLVSQVGLASVPEALPGGLRDASDAEQAAAQCARPTGLPAASVDLHDLYARDGCAPPALRLVSAAMLAARFPTVTPGGRMPVTGEGCAPRPDVQLVDGGYGEASAVGTLADLAPQLASLLRAHNRQADRVVVPVVVFLEEEPRTDLAPEPQGLAPEALVPLAGLRAAATQSASGSWLQRASAALQDVCPPAAAGRTCRRAVAGVRERLPAGAVVVAPRTQPDVDAPLGWTLSGASRTRLTSAMEQQAQPDCRPVGGYGCLGRLLALLHP